MNNLVTHTDRADAPVHGLDLDTQPIPRNVTGWRQRDPPHPHPHPRCPNEKSSPLETLCIQATAELLNAFGPTYGVPTKRPHP